MSAIITITFNPALDKSVSVPELISERKLKCSRPVYEPGGGGINVARAIKKLGGNAIAYYLAGGDAGARITSLLAYEGVETSVTPIAGLTRENLVVFDNASQTQYLFDIQGPTIDHHEYEALLATVARTERVRFIVASGSLTGGIPAEIFGELAKIAKKKNARLVVDTAGEALRHALNQGVYIVKPNRKELTFLTGADELTDDQVPIAAKALIKSGGCEAVVVSLGALGALLVTKNETLKIAAPFAEVKSTVGAGDSLTAGTVIRLAAGENLYNAVQYGVACGTAATLNAGTELCSKRDAERLFSLIKSHTEVLS